MMKFFKHTGYFLILSMMLSCFDPSKPNYQYFPNMYESVGYGTYDESEAFPNGIEAQLPVEESIPRGWQPYEYDNSTDGYELAKVELKSPFEKNEENLTNGKKMYEIYCSVCHGSKGDGNGILMEREKFLGIPSYADRDITEGSIYHVLMYGINLMGSHAGQVNDKERWQISQYVLKLRNDLIK